MNGRDTVLALIALGAAPYGSLAQQPGNVRRIGFLDPRSGPTQGRVTCSAWGRRCLPVQRTTGDCQPCARF